MTFSNLMTSSAADKYSPLPSSSPDLTLKHLLKLLLKAVVTLCVLMGVGLALYATAWIYFQPTSARFEIVSGSISNFEIAGAELSGSWALKINAHNPNIQVFDYSGLVAYVSYHNSEYPLAVGHIKPFSQPGNNWTLLQAQVFAQAQYLNDDVHAKMEDDITRGIVEFDVDVVIDYAYTCPYVVYAPVSGVSCNGIKFELSGVNGTMVEAYPRKCRDVDQGPAAVKEMWFIVFLLSFVYLLIDVIM